jgi:PucR family transcriptional regulator, purine catabolism regulatory protein
MPLTVSRALTQLNVLAKAKVVAGSKGLDRTIRWTHIIDHPDVIPWVKEGHLLMTTAFTLMLHPEEQADLIHSLNEKHLAGMIVNVGRYMLEIPSTMILAADEVDFPLIAIPWEVDFVEVTHAIHEFIIREQYELAEQANHIHKTLTQIVLDGGNLDSLTRTLGDILHCSVIIEDDTLRMLAYATVEPTDDLRQRSIALGRTPDEVAAYFNEQGFFDQLLVTPKPYRISPIPQIGMTLERIVSPILVGSQLYGYIWIIASDEPLNELDYLVIERSATVAALILSREEAVYQSEQRLKARLFDDSLDPTFFLPTVGMTESNWQLGLQKGFIVLAIEASQNKQADLRHLASLFESSMQSESNPIMVVERGQRLVAIMAINDFARMQTLAEDFTNNAEMKGYRILVGLSTLSHQPQSMRQSYQEAIDTVTIAAALGSDCRRVWSYSQLGYLSQLLLSPAESRQANHYLASIEQIIQYDREKNTQYLQTLEAYLDNSASARDTASALFIHRNTLYQRLSKITELWGIDFHDPVVMLNLNIAIKDCRLNKLTRTG